MACLESDAENAISLKHCAFNHIVPGMLLEVVPFVKLIAVVIFVVIVIVGISSGSFRVLG